MLQNLNAKTSQILLKMFTMPTLELSLGTKIKHGLHTRFVEVVLNQWRVPKGHGNDCYFCSCNVSGFNMKNKHNIQYPNLPSAIRPILHQPDVPVPTPPPVLIDVEDSTTSSDLSSSECQSEYECFEGERPRLFSQEELNDLVRDLDLPKVSAVLSSVARGGGARAPPIGLWSMRNRMLFVLLRPIFCEKWKIAPPFENSPPSNVWICEIGRNSSHNFGENLFFFFFWRSPSFGRKKALNFGFRPKNHSECWRRPFFFFGDHLILGGKKLWISELSETFRLKFRTNRLKLIQDQWKFESRSFAHFSLFQNSPPPFSKSWLRAWLFFLVLG